MNERQKLLCKIIKDIINSDECDCKEYYGKVIYVYNDIEKYLDMVDNVYDKIFISQYCNNYKKIRELIKALDLSEYEKIKYADLKSKNEEIDGTLNFRMLSPKYSFLDNILDMVTTDVNIQDQILSMSEERLQVFKEMYERLQECTDYFNPYISRLLLKMGYVTLDSAWQNNYHNQEELLNDIDKNVRQGVKLTDKELDTLLYVLTSSITHNIPSFDELRHFGEPDTKDQKAFVADINNAMETKDLDSLKFIVLSKAYSVGFNYSKFLCGKYDITGIKETSENKDTLDMYRAITQIVNEKDPNVLIKLYNEVIKDKVIDLDFRRITVFENDLKKAFARDLNNQVLKVDHLPSKKVDGVDVYDAGVDFSMIVTAIGAYQSNFKNPDNYMEYWNQPKIASHCNCCSLIGNNNLSTAKVRNVILGFSSMSDNMLLLSGSTDINSTPKSKNFDVDLLTNKSCKFMCASRMLDDTRSDYNELVYERRDLSSNPMYYKKNPDYIVFIQEYEDIEKEIEEYEHLPNKLSYLLLQKGDEDMRWQESIKASKDFNVPIVKINREIVARSEANKIDEMLSTFEDTKDPNLILEIITKFESNRVGNAGMHMPIRNRYFSKTKMANILARIKTVIKYEKNKETKRLLSDTLAKALEIENSLVEKNKAARQKDQISGIDFAREMKDISTFSDDDMNVIR